MDCFDGEDAIALLYLKKKIFPQSRTTVIFMIDEKV